MKNKNSQGSQKSDYRRNASCHTNRDIIEALMDSKELLKKTRELIYKEKTG
jgi:hypothetical protein